jgi:hypothetical protein
VELASERLELCCLGFGRSEPFPYRRQLDFKIECSCASKLRARQLSTQRIQLGFQVRSPRRSTLLLRKLPAEGIQLGSQINGPRGSAVRLDQPPAQQTEIGFQLGGPRGPALRIRKTLPSGCKFRFYMAQSRRFGLCCGHPASQPV